MFDERKQLKRKELLIWCAGSEGAGQKLWNQNRAYE
jgi:hypothetical protein